MKNHKITLAILTTALLLTACGTDTPSQGNKPEPTQEKIKPVLSVSQINDDGTETPILSYGRPESEVKSQEETAALSGLKGIALQDDKFLPTEIEALPGMKVLIANAGQKKHTIIAEKSEACPELAIEKELEPGAHFELVIKETGECLLKDKENAAATSKIIVKAE